MLIDRLGNGIVRETFALTPQALWQWRVRGIPLAKRIAFAKLCADHGAAVPADFFEKFQVEKAA